MIRNLAEGAIYVMLHEIHPEYKKRAHYVYLVVAISVVTTAVRVVAHQGRQSIGLGLSCTTVQF